MRLSCLFLCVMFVQSVLSGDVFNSRMKEDHPEIPKLSLKEENRYKELVRFYVPQLWSNDYSNAEIKIYHYDIMGRNHQDFIQAMIKGKKEKCKLTFDKKKADAVISASNTQYEKCSNDNYETPIHITMSEARKRATEISEIFGISNLWNQAHFDVRSSHFLYGVWRYHLTARINGYPSLYGVSVSIADTQETNIYRWSTTMHDIPSNLGTNVVLNSVDGRAKGQEFFNKYYSDSETVKEATFITNYVEYITPNYYYMRENALEEFHAGGCTNNPVLTWVNYFKSNTGSKYDRHFPIIIYVDAETGAMLGGM